jgi:hypothetical protein
LPARLDAVTNGTDLLLTIDHVARTAVAGRILGEILSDADGGSR